MNSWEQVGEAGVDAGMVMIADPCYTIRNPYDTEYEPFKSYHEHFLPELERQDRQRGIRPLNGDNYQIKNPHFGSRLGVVVGGFGGDGVYPVYVQRDESGMVIAAMIRFDAETP